MTVRLGVIRGEHFKCGVRVLFFFSFVCLFVVVVYFLSRCCQLVL